MTLYERIETLSEADVAPATRRDVLSRAAKASFGVALVLAGLAWNVYGPRRRRPDTKTGAAPRSS